MAAVVSKRKLFDIRMPVFSVLSLQASKDGVSLKKYIENLLEAEAERVRPIVPEGVTDPRILGLIGIAKGAGFSIDPDDDRMQYILSK